jgi:hypothetical protein
MNTASALLLLDARTADMGCITAACGRIRPSEFKVSFVQQACADEARRCNRDIRPEAYLPSPNDALIAAAKPLETNPLIPASGARTVIALIQTQIYGHAGVSVVLAKPRR